MTTIPILTHREGSRLVVVAHAPLPAPVPDPTRDREMCQQALAALLREYVRRFPEQCLLPDPAVADESGGKHSPPLISEFGGSPR